MFIKALNLFKHAGKALSANPRSFQAIPFLTSLLGLALLEAAFF